MERWDGERTLGLGWWLAAFACFAIGGWVFICTVTAIHYL